MEYRVNPDELLEKLKQEDKQEGKLTIFFGYCAGVGKTFAMLAAAQREKQNGKDVLIGYIEPHDRKDTLAMMEGLRLLPTQTFMYRNTVLQEFALDDALAQHPQLIIVDELAHTNATGSRHPKRYMDVAELLHHGIDVYTTLNVQHLESLHDMIAAITHVRVQERIPDKIFDQADKVVLIDIEIDDLLKRLQDGKIYHQAQAVSAMRYFFMQENLIALREITMRKMADHMDIRQKKSLHAIHSVKEHILICLSASPSNAAVIRTAARMANVYHADFTALYVETPKDAYRNAQNTQRLLENTRLAKHLGAKIVNVYGAHIPEQIGEYARIANVSKIVIGRSGASAIARKRNRSLVDQLTIMAPALDIFIIPNHTTQKEKQKSYPTEKMHPWNLHDCLFVAATLFFATIFALILFSFGWKEANIIFIYLCFSLLSAWYTSHTLYSFLFSLGSVLLFNFFFTTPRFSLLAYDSQYPLTFLVMLIASLMISTLMQQTHKKSKETSEHAYRTEILLETSQTLMQAKTTETILSKAGEQLYRMLGRCVIIYAVKDGTLQKPYLYGELFEQEQEETYFNKNEYSVAHWVYQNKHAAGSGTNTLPASKAFYIAVKTHNEVYAVIAITQQKQYPLSVFERSLCTTLVNEIALAMEREYYRTTTQQILLQGERERMRSHLLQVITHDLRTPLTTILGNSELLFTNQKIAETLRQEIIQDTMKEAKWLQMVLDHLMMMQHLEDGTQVIQPFHNYVRYTIANALTHCQNMIKPHLVQVSLNEEGLMGVYDEQLLETVLIHMTITLLRQQKEISPILVSAHMDKNALCFTLSTCANTQISKDIDAVWQEHGDAVHGLSFSISICRSMLKVHHATLDIKKDKEKGIAYSITIPQLS